MREYAKKAQKSDISTEANIADCFDADNDVPVAYKSTDSEIVQMVLNPENEDSEDSDVENNE